MALLGDVAGLTGCIAGVAYKNISRNLRIKRNLDASAYLHGMDRPQATDEEMDIVRAKIAWDIKNRKGEICPLEMLDFFENGAVNKKEAISYWSGCMFEQIFEDAGLNTRKPIYITRGKNYMLDFQSKYSKELYYWRICKKQGIRLNDIPKTCPTCGFHLKDIGEPCPVCGAPALLKVEKSNTQIMKSVEEEQKDMAARFQDSVNRSIRKENIKGAIITACVVVAFMLLYIFVINPLH